MGAGARDDEETNQGKAEQRHCGKACDIPESRNHRPPQADSEEDLNMAMVFRRNGEKRWTISSFDNDGVRRERSARTTDKKLAERIAAKFNDHVIERKLGLVDPAAERLAVERQRPLEAHINDYGRHLATLQRDERHAKATLGYLRTIASELKWTILGHTGSQALTAHLHERGVQRGTGARTFNATAVAWRAIAGWCVHTG